MFCRPTAKVAPYPPACTPAFPRHPPTQGCLIIETSAKPHVGSLLPTESRNQIALRNLNSPSPRLINRSPSRVGKRNPPPALTGPGAPPSRPSREMSRQLLLKRTKERPSFTLSGFPSLCWFGFFSSFPPSPFFPPCQWGLSDFTNQTDGDILLRAGGKITHPGARLSGCL